MSIIDKIVETFDSKRGTSEQNNPHPSPSIQSWGVSCFLQVARRMEQQTLFSIFEFCKMLERPFRANCLNLFCRHELIIIIIHSKYFRDSDWLKAHV